jgi:hypothetical protein
MAIHGFKMGDSGTEMCKIMTVPKKNHISKQVGQSYEREKLETTVTFPQALHIPILQEKEKKNTPTTQTTHPALNYHCLSVEPPALQKKKNRKKTKVHPLTPEKCLNPAPRPRTPRRHTLPGKHATNTKSKPYTEHKKRTANTSQMAQCPLSSGFEENLKQGTKPPSIRSTLD